jgi:hypothetical protein
MSAWLSWSELQQLLDGETLRRLRPHLTPTGLDGLPCIEQDRLDDLLGLLGPDDGEDADA